LDRRKEAIDILQKEFGADRGEIAMTYLGIVGASQITDLVGAMKDIGDLNCPSDVTRFLARGIRSHVK
jgi:hypothetical protein